MVAELLRERADVYFLGKEGEELEDVKTEVSPDDYLKYYSHIFYCRNCLERNLRYIKKGRCLDTIAFECDKCGCIVRGGVK